MKPMLAASALAVLVLAVASCDRPARPGPAGYGEFASGLGYTNERVSRVPWSIHVVRVDRTAPEFAIHSVHALGGALGLTPLSAQLARMPLALGTPVAAVNGDFYQRDRDYAGDPRGLQIVDGELLSAPNGGVAFWMDAAGQPHATNVVSRFQAVWPDNTTIPFGLNEERRPDSLVLYTPAVGRTTRSSGGRELVLEPEPKPDPALRIGESIAAKVQELRKAGDTVLKPGTLILSAGPALAKRLPPMAVGDVIRLSTATTPDLQGARTALGGGPVLVRNGSVQKIRPPSSDSYEFSSMLERHPRTALGWDPRYFYLVTVDGRQERLSVGMTLEELAEYLAGLGCSEAMNLDGGGSATLWSLGRVRNSPCDGEERSIANGLVVTRKVPAEMAPRESDPPQDPRAKSPE